MNIINTKNSHYLSFPLALLFLFIPFRTYAFLNFCFPISFTLLVFILSWPSMILYEFGYQISTNFISVGFVVIGVIVNFLLVLVIGYLVDLWKRKNGYLPKKYYLKLPLLFIILISILFILTFFDKSCFGSN